MTAPSEDATPSAANPDPGAEVPGGDDAHAAGGAASPETPASSLGPRIFSGLQRGLTRAWTLFVGRTTSSREKVVRILIVGLVVRLLLLPFTGEADLSSFGEASQTFLYGGGTYAYLQVYPPAWEDYLNAVGLGSSFLTGGGPLLATSPALLAANARYGYPQPAAWVVPTYAVLEKLPLIGADLLIALLLHRIVLRGTGSPDKAVATFALWFLNPLVIVDSSIHGAFDVLPVACVLAAWVLLEERHLLTAGVATGLGASLKLFPLFLLPLLLLLALRSAQRARAPLPRSLATFLLPVVAVSAVFFLPPGVLSEYLLYSTTGTGVGEAFYGFGPWGFLSVPVLNTPGRWLMENTSAVLVLCSAVAVALVALVFLSLRRQQELRPFAFPVLVGAFVSVYASWLSSSEVHPQYVEWILPFLLLIYVLYQRWGAVFWAASLLPTLYYLLVLGNPGIFLEPLALYTHVLSLSGLIGGYATWAPWVPVFATFTALPGSAALLYALGRSVQELLPRKGVAA